MKDELPPAMVQLVTLMSEEQMQDLKDHLEKTIALCEQFTNSIAKLIDAATKDSTDE